MDSLELTHPYLLHPRTGEPLRAVGVLPNGRVVWPIMGGDGSESDANDSGADDAGNDDGTDDDGTDDGNEDQSEDARLQRANRQASRYRTELRESQTQLSELQAQHEQTTAVLNALRQALVPDAGDGDGDPAVQVTELTGRIESLTTENASLRAELLVHSIAGEHGGNPVALLDSREFVAALQGLDPEGEDYRTEVAEAIKAAVSKNAAYRAGQGSSSGGSELDGEREKQQRRSKGLGGAIAAALGG